MKKLMYFVIAVAVLTGLNTAVVADFDPEEILTSMDEFLIHQMEVFDSVRPPAQPPLIQSYAWDPDVPFPPGDLDPPPLWQMVYRGDTYDQSLAVCYFVSRSKTNPSYLDRARKLLDAIIFLEEHDPYADGRVRAAYWANNLLDPSGTQSSIMDPDAGAGNIAWFGIALTRFYDVAEKKDYLDPQTRQYYLDIAKEKANWILDHCTDSAPCGFTGGYGGWGQVPFNWKSAEHNIDVYVFARNLYALDGEPKWAEMAGRAACLVQGMFVNENGSCGHYLTGTLEDGITPNPSPIPADAQSWTALARRNGIKIDTDERAECAMQWLIDPSNLLLVDCCGCPENDCCHGVAFSNQGENVQTEVTAGAAMALWLMGWYEDAMCLFNCLEWTRLNAYRPDDGIEDGIGIVATPCPEGASTGYGSWYYKLLHVASSAWTGLSVMVMQGDEIANPLMPLPNNHTPIADAGDDQVAYACANGMAEVKLDGSGSYDPDGDALEYFWFIGDEQIATEVDPNVELAIGEHTIELIVNDGSEDSEPNAVVITVIEPIEADVHIVPRVINRNNRLKRVMAIVRLPAGISKDDVLPESFKLYVGELDSEPIGAILERVIGWGNMTRVFVLFDKDELMDEVMNVVGDVEMVDLTVVGRLESGQYIQGSDTVRIVKPRRLRPHWQAGRRRR